MRTELADGALRDQAAVGPRRDGPLPAAQAPAYVLVVDDQAVVRDFLTRCMRDGGYSVRQAGSAAEALDVMTDTPAALVLCDIKMPDHDGLWLTEQLRAQWPGTPVVMATGVDDAETIAKCRQLGVIGYLTKPIVPAQLLRTVHRAIAPGDEDVPAPPPPRATPIPLDEIRTQLDRIEVEYRLECPLRCPTCGDTMTMVKAVRLLRTHVNFTSTFPRRGHLIACPHCFAVLPAELTTF